MKLREMRIQNFKSIEDARVENIGDINILSGRNNSGKSAIFGALTILPNFRIFPVVNVTVMQPDLFTGHDFHNRIMEMTLTLELDDSERFEGVSRYCEESSDEFREETLKSSFLSKIEYHFRSFKGKTQFGLQRIRIIGADGRFGTLAERKDEESNFKITPIFDLCKERKGLESAELDTVKTAIKPNLQKEFRFNFPFEIFNKFIHKIYSFSPFRTSARRLQAQETKELSPNGQNLVKRLFTMKSNEDENWGLLQQFVKTALPGLGSLQARQIGNETETHFRDKKWNIEIDLHDMGSGIEQLLMIACVLISESQGSLVLIETPEHHLHPGAQRRLLQFIRENLKDNQILIATHSPIFLSQKDLAMHIVTKTAEGTKVQKVEELEDLSQALIELGSRNSDLLLADFVLFVEGSSDEKIIKAWAKTLGVDFDSKNIFCIPIGGSRNFDYYANSDVLRRISLKSPIPHLFIIDRDEKSNDTIQKIQEQVKEIHIFERREIENYLLLPKSILESMRVKARGNSEILKNIETVQVRDIDRLISSKIGELKNIVLLKRIKEEIGGGTFLPDTELKNLIEEKKYLDLDALVVKTYGIVTKTLSDKCGKERIRNIVKQQASIIEKVWVEGNEEEKRKIVPGEEILKGIFGKFGLRYDKAKDGERTAQRMRAEEIQPEIKSIIEKLQ